MVENLLYSLLGVGISIGYYLIRNLPLKWEKRGIEAKPSNLTLFVIAIFSTAYGLLISNDAYPIAGLLISAIAFTTLLAGYVDWKTCRIPNELMFLPWLIFPITLIFSFNMESLLILTATMVALLLAGIITNFITKGKLGGGDIKMLLTFGLLSYFIDPMVIFYGLFISFFIQLILRYLWRKQNGTAELGAPYGAALALGVLNSAIIFG
jgi:Flp pilus assembly protein protease CpaA